MKGLQTLQSSLQMKGIIIIPDTIWRQLTSTTIHPSCRCNNQQGYFPLFLCHGHGRISESNAQITAVILIETFEWISKVDTECVAADRFSLGQPRYYFLRLWKGKVLTDLLEVTLVFPPTCSQLLSPNASSLSHAHSGKTTLPQRVSAVSGIQESACGSRSLPSEAPSLDTGLSCSESLPGILIVSAEVRLCERPLQTRTFPECLWSLPGPF